MSCSPNSCMYVYVVLTYTTERAGKTATFALAGSIPQEGSRLLHVEKPLLAVLMPECLCGTCWVGICTTIKLERLNVPAGLNLQRKSFCFNYINVVGDTRCQRKCSGVYG